MGVSVIIRSLQEPVGRRRAVLRALCASRVPMSIAAIAGKLGVHPNTVRFHLDNLVADGQVERVEPGRGRPGRPPLMFRAVRRTDSTGTRRYRLLAEILASGLAAERDSRVMALSAGRAWGRQLEAPPAGADTEETIDHLVAVLDDLGFAPERRASNGRQQVGLRHCPFLELAETQAGVVCPVHLRDHAGSLANMGGASHRRPARRVRRTRPVPGPLHAAGRSHSVSAGPAIEVAVAFVWLGMVVAISFLEAPLKFRAAGVTLQIGLGIGRLVFRALNTVEVGFALVILAIVVVGSTPARIAAAFSVALAALAVQLIAVRPRLTRRSNQVLAGLQAPRSRGHHIYVGLEIVKVVALLVAGILLLNG